MCFVIVSSKMSETEKEKIYEFSFNDQLPRIYEVVNAVLSVEPAVAGHRKGKPESLTRQAVVHSCSVKLQRLWEQAFGTNFIKSITAIKYQLRKDLDDYAKFMKKFKGKTDREKIKLWRQENSTLFYCFSPKFNPENFDKLEQFETEKRFFSDQLGPRKMFLSEEVDEEYEKARSIRIAQLLEAQESYQSEISYIFGDNDVADQAEASTSKANAPTLTTNTTRSGLVRQAKSTNSIKIQTDLYNVIQPPVRKVKVCTDAIKTALSEVSIVAQISPDKARKACQAFSKNFYGHTYYLSLQEKYPDHIPKKPRTVDDYVAYSDVFPDKKTIANHKHGQALQRELDAASALINKTSTSKAILHFDTTKRSRIEGDWPSLILNIRSPPNHTRKFTLRPLYFAYEDRENISKLIVETHYRLSVTVGSTPKILWEKIDGVMTDSVTKNLDIESLVAAKLGSTHIPPHYLCNAHVSEKFDDAVLSVLATIEKEVSLRQKLEASNPQLKSFYRGKKSIVECALTALCKLISPDSSAKSSSLSEEFDILIEKEGRVKLVAMYQERKFTKLGTTSACVVNTLDLYDRLLEQTPKNNLLVKACRLYLSCEFIVCAFKCLGYFTYKIGMPYLNMCEMSSQKEMKSLLPRFYQDLKEQNLNCLDDYHVEWNRIKVEEPMSDLGKYIINKMCEATAEGVRIQKGREYGFFGEEFKERATNVSQMSDEDLELIPSHNLDCERNLSIAGIYMEQSSKCSNRYFKSRCTRDNVTLHKTSQMNKIGQDLKVMLDQREEAWYEIQKKLKAEHIETLIERGKNRDNYIDKVLAKCKSWGGPFLCIDDMKASINGKSDDEQRKILRHEITFQKSTHPNDALHRKEIYLINKQDVSTMIYNLGIILSNDSMREENDGEVFLPTEEDILAILATQSSNGEANVQTIGETEAENIGEQWSQIIAINELCAVVWDHRGKRNWYLGYTLNIIDDNSIEVEHLERVVPSNDSSWRYPKTYTDVQEVELAQVLPIKIESEWDYTDPQVSILAVENASDISSCFRTFVLET